MYTASELNERGKLRTSVGKAFELVVLADGLAVPVPPTNPLLQRSVVQQALRLQQTI